MSMTLETIIDQCKHKKFEEMHMCAPLKQMAPKILMVACQEVHNDNSQYSLKGFDEKLIVTVFSPFASMYSMVHLMDFAEAYKLAKIDVEDDETAQKISDYVKDNAAKLGLLLEDKSIPQNFKDACIEFFPFLKGTQYERIPQLHGEACNEKDYITFMSMFNSFSEKNCMPMINKSNIINLFMLSETCNTSNITNLCEKWLWDNIDKELVISFLQKSVSGKYTGVGTSICLHQIFSGGSEKLIQLLLNSKGDLNVELCQELIFRKNKLPLRIDKSKNLNSITCEAWLPNAEDTKVMNKLNLSRINFTFDEDTTKEQLTSVLTLIPKIPAKQIELSFEYHDIAEEPVALIAKLLKDDPRIIALKIDQNNINQKDMITLINAASKGQSLETIELTHRRLTLFERYRHITIENYRHLDCISTGQVYSPKRTIAAYKKEWNERYDLQNNNGQEDERIESIAEMIKSLKSLKSLMLFDESANKVSVETIAQAIEENHTLEKITLKFSFLPLTAIERIVESVCNHPTAMSGELSFWIKKGSVDEEVEKISERLSEKFEAQKNIEIKLIESE